MRIAKSSCGICVADPACTVAVFEEGDPEGGTCHVKAESKAGYAKRGYWACRARPKAESGGYDE